MGIVNGKYVNPGWKNGQAPALEETELNAISDTLEALDAGGGGRRYANFVVGTSTAGWTAADCDYICDGVDDDVEINAAIEACNENGEVVILSGVYNISSPVSSNKVDITGVGNPTLKRQTEDGGGTYKVFISISQCKIKNLLLDGNGSIMTGNVADLAAGGQSEIENVEFNNAKYACVVASPYNSITGVIIRNCKFLFGTIAILSLTAQELQVVNNYCVPQKLLKSTTTDAGPAATIKIRGNICGNRSFLGGAIEMDAPSASVISGNETSGIEITNDYNVNCGGTVIIGNHVSPISDNDPCIVLGQNVQGVLVTGNNLTGSSGPTTKGVVQDNGSNNLVVNNFTN